AIFAITGALVARGKNIDLYGVTVFSFVTAVGGGTVRDMLLGLTPVFWIEDPTYVVVSVVFGLGTFALARRLKLPAQLLIVADAFGLALFTVIGYQIGAGATGNPLVALIMGVLTGTGGGLIRDLLNGTVPLVLKEEIYASASILGALLMLAGPPLGVPTSVTIMGSMATIIIVRLVTIYRKQSLPKFE
ncbi:MAG: trimeric intracellular cation channel family protein, partial [Chloroflexota bacterium]